MQEQDRQILRILQENHRITIDALTDEVGLSATTMQRHLKRMHSSGLIERVSRDQFKRDMRNAPEVQQCYYVTSSNDSS